MTVLAAVNRPTIRHLAPLTEAERGRLFAAPSLPTSPADGRRRYLAALGPLLYVPAARHDLISAIRRRHAAGVVGLIVDLEDSVPDSGVARAQANVDSLLRDLRERPVPGLALYVRVRRPADMIPYTGRFADTPGLAGFVLPKCTPEGLGEAVDLLTDLLPGPLLMPVVEGVEYVDASVRPASLRRLANALERHRERVLAVRFGAVDLAGRYGLRLGRGGVHGVPMLASALGDLVSVVTGRVDLPVSGAVNETFDPVGGTGDLLDELALDRAAGLWGKSVVHPRQALAVLATGPVTHHDHADALAVAAALDGGVAASADRRRMNEARPHARWAAETLERAASCGILAEGVSACDLLTALSARVA